MLLWSVSSLKVTLLNCYLLALLFYSQSLTVWANSAINSLGGEGESMQVSMIIHAFSRPVSGTETG